jgi:hypothetical protein
LRHKRSAADCSEETLLSAIDRLAFVALYRLFPNVREALTIVKPETIVRWHRAKFRSYWRWKSRPRGGRPTVPLEMRQLIRKMSIANPLWGAPRIHGELLKLGVGIGQTSVAKYMVRPRDPPSQGIAPSVSMPAARQNRSKDADTSSHALPIGAFGIAFVIMVDVFMALLSFRGISTPSLPAQGEQRPSS